MVVLAWQVDGAALEGKSSTRLYRELTARPIPPVKVALAPYLRHSSPLRACYLTFALRAHCAPLQSVVNRQHRRETRLCPLCHEADEDPDHFLMACAAWDGQRAQLGQTAAHAGLGSVLRQSTRQQLLVILLGRQDGSLLSAAQHLALDLMAKQFVNDCYQARIGALGWRPLGTFGVSPAFGKRKHTEGG